MIDKDKVVVENVEDHFETDGRQKIYDTPTGYPEWKHKIPDAGYRPENWDEMSLEEKVDYLFKVLKSWRKEWKRDDNALFPAVAVEDHDVEGDGPLDVSGP